MNTWAHNKRLTFVLLIIWIVGTLLVGFTPSWLRFDFYGWEFSYWWAGQGVILLYLFLTWFYAFKMHQIDEKNKKNQIPK